VGEGGGMGRRRADLISRGKSQIGGERLA